MPGPKLRTPAAEATGCLPVSDLRATHSCTARQTRKNGRASDRENSDVHSKKYMMEALYNDTEDQKPTKLLVSRSAPSPLRTPTVNMYIRICIYVYICIYIYIHTHIRSYAQPVQCRHHWPMWTKQNGSQRYCNTVYEVHIEVTRLQTRTFFLRSTDHALTTLMSHT